jgi:hypothetical protein
MLRLTITRDIAIGFVHLSACTPLLKLCLGENEEGSIAQPDAESMMTKGKQNDLVLMINRLVRSVGTLDVFFVAGCESEWRKAMFISWTTTSRSYWLANSANQITRNIYRPLELLVCVKIALQTSTFSAGAKIKPHSSLSRSTKRNDGPKEIQYVFPGLNGNCVR